MLIISAQPQLNVVVKLSAMAMELFQHVEFAGILQVLRHLEIALTGR